MSQTKKSDLPGRPLPFIPAGLLDLRRFLASVPAVEQPEEPAEEVRR